jgi:NADPH:quinone reductase-like Zn-dependent oxidoreductase
MINTAAASMFGHQQLRPAIKFQNRADLLILKDLIEAGKVTPVIDRTYPLSQTGEAIGHVGEGHTRGTVVINM